MNVSRSTFVRRGWVLTALAVAVLLAGFSGTAWAQTTTVGSPSASDLQCERPQARWMRVQMKWRPRRGELR